MIAGKTTMALLFAWLMRGTVRTALGRARRYRPSGFFPSLWRSSRTADRVFGKASAFAEVSPLFFPPLFRAQR